VAKNLNATAAIDDKGFAPAVWVDLDFACGQCHGGSFGNTEIHNGAPYYSKAQLAPLAAGMHTAAGSSFPPTHNSPVAVCGAALGSGTTSTNFALNTATSTADTINSVLPMEYVNWGDGSAMASGAVASTFHHTYQNNGSYNVTMVVKDALGYSASCSNTATVNNNTGGAATGSVHVTTSNNLNKVTVYLTGTTGNNVHLQFSGSTSGSGTLDLPLMANSMPQDTYTVKVYAPFGHTCTAPASVAVTGLATPLALTCN